MRRDGLSGVGAIVEGVAATLGSPRLLLGLWLVNLLLALPAAWALTASLQDSIGPGLVHRELRDGFDMGWYGEYRADARGIEKSFAPNVVGVAPFLDNLEDWLTGELFREFPELVGLGLLFAVLWIFLLGGIVDHYVRQPGERSPGHFARACGSYFFRFLRLALIAALTYFAIYRVHGWLYARLADWTRDVTSERTVLLVSLVALAATAFLLTVAHMSFAYAKIATVVEKRRGMLFAALRGIGFVLSHPVKTLSLYYGLLLVSASLLWLYALVAPGAGQSGASTILLAFGVGQLYLMVKLGMRLSLLGAQTALYRSV